MLQYYNMHADIIQENNCDSNASVRLSVRLSDTSLYCIKTKKASVMISSPPASHTILVFWRQILSNNILRGSPEWGLKKGWVEKIQRFSSFKRQYLENGSTHGQSYY